MPKVTLIDCTGRGNPDPLYAAKLLCFTKNTRMEMTSSLQALDSWPEEKLLEQLQYMARTIPSSWEFLHMTFLFSEVSRATAQQITRTRKASYAMQSQRVTDMSNVTFDHRTGDFDAAMRNGISSYSELVDGGVSFEDAREVLPIGVHCNLVAGYDFRTIVELCLKRDSLRVQGPYVEIVRQMKAIVLQQWPWAKAFFIPKNQSSIAIIEEVALKLREAEGEKGAMYNGLSGQLAKAADLLKGE